MNSDLNSVTALPPNHPVGNRMPHHFVCVLCVGANRAQSYTNIHLFISIHILFAHAESFRTSYVDRSCGRSKVAAQAGRLRSVLGARRVTSLYSDTIASGNMQSVCTRAPKRRPSLAPTTMVVVVGIAQVIMMMQLLWLLLLSMNYKRTEIVLNVSGQARTRTHTRKCHPAPHRSAHHQPASTALRFDSLTRHETISKHAHWTVVVVVRSSNVHSRLLHASDAIN